jgi:hypothetical protein
MSTPAPSVHASAAARDPANFFLFASEWRSLAKELNVPHGSGASDDEIAVAVIDSVHTKQPSDRLMIMFDAGDPAKPKDFPQRGLERARAIGAELAIYVEGPGGPTGDEWTKDEKDRVRRAGESMGIPPGLKFEKFLELWDAGTWRDYTFKQLAGFLAKGISAAEIDNLDRVLGDDDEGKKLVEFLQTYAEQHKAGRLPRLILKNIEEERLANVARAVLNGKVPRAMLSEFHVFEVEPPAPNPQVRESEKIAIRTLFSRDTDLYRAHGRYGLEARFAEIMRA